MVELQESIPAGAGSVFERAGDEVELHELHPRETAVVSLHVTAAEIATSIGGAFGEVAAAMATAGVDLAGPPFTRYFSFGPTFDAEAGFPVLRPAPDIGRVHPARLPGGRVASVVHIGPYETIKDSYEVLMARVGEMGLQPLGPMWEVYWSDPGAEPDPSTWRTEILLPVG